MTADTSVNWTVFEAQVIATSPATGEVIVRTIARNSPPRQISCVMAAPFFGYALGVRQFALPEINSIVIVLDAGTPAIIGVIPEGVLLHTDPFGDGSVTGRDIAAYASPEIKSGVTAGQLPSDMVPGEVAYQNALGVGWSLLRTMSKMQAGPRAAIECFLTEELVRVISAYYRHIHAAGEIVSYDDGGANMIFRFVETLEDALGIDRAQEKSGLNLGDISEKDNIDGKWIAEIYAGKLGGYLNAFFTRPGSAQFDGNFSSGISRIACMHDGSVLAQSTADIGLERVAAIPVPKRRAPEMTKNAMSPEEKQNAANKYTQDKIGNPRDLPYRLHEYARWLAQVRGLERFLQISPKDAGFKEYEIPSETEAAQSGGIYATIRILRTGAIVLLDSAGNSIVMDGNGMSVSSVTDLRFEAAKDIEFLAGRNLKIVGRNSVIIAALKEKLFTYAKKALRLFCDDGTIWLKSDAQHDSENLVHDCGILANSKMSVRAESKKDVILNSIMENIYVSAQKGIFYAKAKSINLTASLYALIQGAKYAIVKSSRVCLDAAVSWIGRKCRIFSNGAAHTQNLYAAQSVHSRQSFASYFAGTEVHGSGIPGYTPPVSNQMSIDDEDSLTEASGQILDPLSAITKIVTEDFQEQQQEDIYQTLSQQRLSADAKTTNSYVSDLYEEADISAEAKIDNNRFDLLGKKRIKFFDPEIPLHVLCETNGADPNSTLNNVSTPKVTSVRTMYCYKPEPS